MTPDQQLILGWLLLAILLGGIYGWLAYQIADHRDKNWIVVKTDGDIVYEHHKKYPKRRRWHCVKRNEPRLNWDWLRGRTDAL